MRIYKYKWLIIWHLKNIRKYAPLSFENFEIEIHSGEEFVFSITCRALKNLSLQKIYRQVSTKLALSQKLIKTILKTCLPENSLTQIITLFNFSDGEKFKRKDINPQIAEELLVMTVPGKPNSRLQKYYTTEKGKSLLCQDGSN